MSFLNDLMGAFSSNDLEEKVEDLEDQILSLTLELEEANAYRKLYESYKQAYEAMRDIVMSIDVDAI